jgi:hypothetical protein
MVTYTNRDGYFTMVVPTDKELPIHLARDGFLPISQSLHTNPDRTNRCDLTMQPVYTGCLRNKTIIIDPIPPSADSTAAVFDNTQYIARCLADYLKKSGALGVMTTAAPPLSPAEKVALANRTKAQLYIAIRSNNGSGSVSLGHYYNSGDGSRLAGLMAEELKQQLTLNSIFATDDDGYVVMQTGCPAVAAELSLGKAHHAGVCRKEAYALYTALVRYYGVTPALRDFPYVVVEKNTALRVSGAMVSIDDVLTLESGSDGICHFRWLEKGAHRLQVRLGDKILGEEIFTVPFE